jgi:TIR domain
VAYEFKRQGKAMPEKGATAGNIRAPVSSTGGESATEAKLKVFISYARADLAFVDALVVEIERHEIEALIDRRDLPYGEQWKPELLDFVRRSDAVVFVVSPRSIASRWCKWEVEQVEAESKRLVPIVLEPVPSADLPTQIADIHLLLFTDTWNSTSGSGEDFLGRAAMLAKVLVTDRRWLKDHTRLAELARRWDDTRRSAGSARAEALLLRGGALAEAELWISRRPREAPEPTELHRTYVQESRKAEQARAEAERLQLARTRRLQRVGARRPFDVSNYHSLNSAGQTPVHNQSLIACKILVCPCVVLFVRSGR